MIFFFLIIIPVSQDCSLCKHRTDHISESKFGILSCIKPSTCGVDASNNFQHKLKQYCTEHIVG